MLYYSDLCFIISAVAKARRAEMMKQMDKTEKERIQKHEVGLCFRSIFAIFDFVID